MIHFAIVSGSHRPEAESLKVSKFIEAWIRKEKKGARVSLLSLSGNPFPIWDESGWTDQPPWAAQWKPYSDALKSADAVIIVSPEWAGMAPAGLKNFFLLCSQQELSHKPGMIVAVSAGTGGAYPIAELRMSSYKNTQFNYIPDHVIIRRVKEVLNDLEKPASKDDELTRQRLAYSINVLEQYGLALRQVRESGVINLKDFPNGM